MFVGEQVMYGIHTADVIPYNNYKCNVLFLFPIVNEIMDE